MLLLRQTLAQYGKDAYQVHSRATRWAKAERMSDFGQRAVIRSAVHLEMLQMIPDFARIEAVVESAKAHVSRALASFDLSSVTHIFAMEHGHADRINDEFKKLNHQPWRITKWSDWDPRIEQTITLVNVPDDAWDLANKRQIKTLAHDADRAVSYEYDRQAELLAFYAKEIARRLP